MSRSRRIRASTEPAWKKPGLGAALRSTIWCRWDTARDIGEHSLLASQVGLAGSTDIGNHVILTGQVGVVGHCKIGDGAIVTPQSGVAGDIDAGAIVSGAPAVDHKLWLKYSAVLPKLPEIARAVRAKNPKD